MDAKGRAIVLLSGGLDSTTTLAWAHREGYSCYALSIDYGQRHAVELAAARRAAAAWSAVRHQIVPLDMRWVGGSALTDSSIEVPSRPSDGIPVTYVPARNTIFLALALGWAEALDAHDIFIGANAVDYSGYPDCRPGFLASFEVMANLATKAGIEGRPFRIRAPLIAMSKAEIIRTGLRLGVDYGGTISCYSPDAEGHPCGRCDSCRLRAKGFADAGVADPALAFDSRNRRNK
ncbi:MAG: 7-cyano-7-deazaguanine synthase QueC [Gammaproteobacteria bacterium]|nr:7-cyano-7-deazaguanine synthase QueC [Gammaproteobacteria bacterium]